jgi:translation initiation factor 4G
MATAFCEKKIHLEPEELLAAVVDFIFEKAVDEPTFCQMYADLCKRQSDEEKSANDNGKFLQAVIRKCQGGT